MEKNFEEELLALSYEKYSKSISDIGTEEVYALLGSYVLGKCKEQKKGEDKGKKAIYFSAEFLPGKLIFSSLFNMGLLERTKKLLEENGINPDKLSDLPDAGLGNGGLGRLASCLLDSAASCDISLDGYSIRYKHGLFRQLIAPDGSQQELPDTWQDKGDPCGIKREDKAVIVDFKDFSVTAVPYDYYIVGYDLSRVNKLRLYESRPLCAWDKSKSEEIYQCLYPDDTTAKGKKLRLRQEYFFTSAALQNIIDEYGLEDIENRVKIQLNDTHPVIAIAEFINIAVKKSLSFDDAFSKCRRVFAYTNHTVMPEALEKWSYDLMKEILPQITGIIEKINDLLMLEIKNKSLECIRSCAIISDNMINMANLACFVCENINGVAPLHTEILKQEVLSFWYELYPEKFSNKTNGITHRQWLGISNPVLTDFISGLLSTDIIKNISDIERLKNFKADSQVKKRLYEIRKLNKERLCDLIYRRQGVSLNSDSLFFVQVKRIHEYKRQLSGIFLAIYFYRKFICEEGTSLPAMTFIFGGKAAPSYALAKSVIRFINKVSEKINEDTRVKEKIRCVFIADYSVSYAEKIMPAADVSMQLSLAGTEASGTGNMKFMLNGAVTLGTYDGANIEIFKKAGEENSYIFGLRKEQVQKLRDDYSPKAIYDTDKEIKALVDSLTDGSFSSANDFRDIYSSLLEGENPDRYMVLKDMRELISVSERLCRDYTDKDSFFEKCLMNMASAGDFSSDRTVREYAEDIWFK